MNDRNKEAIKSGFSLRSSKGMVALAVVAVVAFSLGGLFFGGSEPSNGSHADNEATAEKAPTVWTCAMHPQIKLPTEGKCPICFMDLIPLQTGADDDLGPRQLRLSDAARQLARIQTTAAIRAFAEVEVRMVGRITYDETSLAYITAWVAGRLDKLYANYTGMTVNQGDHMVYMYSPQLLAAQEELLQASVAIVALGQTESVVLKSTAEATLDAAREKLRLYGLSEKQIKDIETSGKTTDHLTINAPVGGTVVHKNAQEGMYVKTGSRIYTIADLHQLWVIFEAYESNLQWLRYGQKVSFTSASFPGEIFEALVSFIDPVVDPKTRTVKVRAIVDNSDLKLKPDMFVHGVVQSRVDSDGRVIDEYLAGKWIGPMHPEIVKDGPGQCDICDMDLVPAESLGYAGRALSDTDAPLLIPASAPLITGRRAVVYVEISDEEGPVFEGREVMLGPRAGDFYVVKSGIDEGDLVVTNGAFKLDAELQIQAKPSMMSPTGGAGQIGHAHGQTDDAMAGMRQVPKGKGEGKKAIDALTSVYATYFDVQMALAGDDLQATQTAAGSLGNEISQVEMALFSRSGHATWMTLSKRLREFSAAAAKSEDITAARAAFYDLSKTIIELHDAFGHVDNRDYFLTFCPMANDNQGAYWLQTVDTVYNSFYGDMMLRCGEIKKPLSAQAADGN